MNFSKHDWTPLLQHMERRAVIPVIGADLLRIDRGGTEVAWHEHLAALLAEALEMPADGEVPASLHEVTCRYIKRGGDIDHVYSALMEVTPEATAPIPKALRLLAEIDAFDLYVTTTFDRLLERAIDEARFGGEKRTRSFAFAPQETGDLDGELATYRGKPAVFHLFGRLSAIPSYAVTEEDVLEWLHALQSENRRPQRLIDALSGCHLLILASGFSNWLARFFIRATKRAPLNRRRELDILADDQLSSDSALVLFLEHFSSRTKIFEGTATQFVEELHARWSAASTSRPKSAPPQPETSADDAELGPIFVSYAAEDRPAARRICDGLEGAGLDVWFDESDLSPGGRVDPVIASRIERAAFFIAVVSKAALTGKPRYFRLEWAEALKRERMGRWDLPFVVPVAIDEVAPSDPAIEPELRSKSWYFLSGGEVTEEFIDKMRRLYRDQQVALASMP